LKKKWFCAQIGAREHYAVPRVLYREGQLAALYTDYWAGPIIRQVARKTNKIQSLATRFHPDLADAPVTSWNTRSLAWEAGVRRDKNLNPYEGFIRIGARFSISVREALSRRNDLDSTATFFAYDTGALEAMQWCRERGIQCILNQMDPNRVEVEMVREEENLWPGWSIQSLNVPEDYFRRREQEWALADTVVVNSEFCREALVRQGVPEAKIAIVPLCFEADHRKTGADDKSNREPKSKAKLRILFLGQVILRKGIQYLMQAAKLLENEPIQFDIVGPVGISSAAVASASKNMVFHGRATRDQTAGWYRQSDVFVLPTLSDGFAITQLEAMSYGLPIVATPCCGEVVCDGSDGFIVPPRNPDALAKAFQRYLAEPGLIQHQRKAANAKVKQFTLNSLAFHLHSLGKNSVPV
jgi:glycosyltransferase involved in cell wall biosynthesis